MRVVYMGTPEFAVPCLRALHAAGYEIAMVISQPDRPHGRGGKATPTPVAAAARALGLPLAQPEKVNAAESIAQIRAAAPEVIVVVAFGQILRPPILAIPPLGCVNVHASLLPKYRGGSPVQHALLHGESVTGVTTMLMDPGMDTGPMLLRREVPVAENDTAGTLLDRLSHVGADLLLETLPTLTAGRLEPMPQDSSRATYAPNLKRDDARIDWGRAAVEIRNQIRAFNPKPGAWTQLQGREIKVWWAEAAAHTAEAAPGTVIAADADGILVATGSGTLRLREVQEAGKARLSAAAFARGVRLKPGEQFA